MRERYYQVEWAKGFDSTRALIERMSNIRRPFSLNTIKQYCHSVLLFCKYMQEDSPDKVLAKVKGEPKPFVDGYIDYLLQKRKQAPKTVRGLFYGLKFWLEVNGVNTSSLEDIVLPKATPKTEDRMPTRAELRQIMDFGNIRDKALTEIAITSGLRVNTIASLKLKDVVWNPYSLIEENAPENEQTPALIEIEPKTGRKATRKFFTFITPEAKKVLRQYLDWRKRKGEQLNSDSPLIASIFGEGKEKHFVNIAKTKPLGSTVSADMLITAWKRLLQKAGFTQKSHKWFELHFHTLRKFFKTQCVNAGVRSQYIEFWMGHKGEYLDDSYFRANLKEHLAEYQKAIPYLSIYETVSEVDRRKQQIRDLAMLVFANEPEKLSMLENLLAKAKSVEDIELGLKNVMGYFRRAEPEQQRQKRKREAEDCQRIVTEAELPKWLKQGWKTQTVLPSGKIVISNE